MKAVRIVTSVLTWVVLAAGLGLVALLVVVPRVTGTIPLTVYTGSMEPTIAAGATILIEPVDPATLQVGDVITYQVAPDVDEYITHRITAVHPETSPPTFTTKGDNNAGEDLDPVPVGAVRGKVWFDVPYLGDASEFVTSRTGIALIAVGGGLVLLGSVLARLLRKDPDSSTSTYSSDDEREPPAAPGRFEDLPTDVLHRIGSPRTGPPGAGSSRAAPDAPRRAGSDVVHRGGPGTAHRAGPDVGHRAGSDTAHRAGPATSAGSDVPSRAGHDAARGGGPAEDPGHGMPAWFNPGAHGSPVNRSPAEHQHPGRQRVGERTW